MPPNRAFATLCLILALSTASHAQTPTAKATGTFEVKLDPQPADENSGGAAISRMLLDKQFHGDLEGTSKGTMLSAGSPAKGAGAYVALELVTGTLKGQRGTFVLQHTGTINNGVPQLNITVVPGSGTGQLTGLSGKMNIIITQGRHSYDFDYTFPQTP